MIRLKPRGLLFCFGGVLGLAGVLLWMVWSAWLTGPVISDSWQSAGPSALSRWPFDLKGLYLGDFDGYEKVWGHHWPGWPLFLSLFRPWLPFHPVIQFSIGALLASLSSLWICKVVSPGMRWWKVASFGCIALLSPEINVSLSMMRPEPLTGLVMVGLAWAVIDGPERKRDYALISLAAAFLPILHVLGVIAPPAMIGVVILWHRFSPSAVRNDPRCEKLLVLAGGWLVGVVMLAVWFLGNSDRLHQFKANLSAQRLSAHAFLNSARSCYLAETGGIMMLCMWIALGCVMVGALRKKPDHFRILLWGAMPVASLLFSLLSHNPNRLHLASVVPCALVACGISGFKNRKSSITRGARLLVAVMVYSLAFHANRAVKIWSSGAACSRPVLVELLKRHQGSGKIFIPVSLWEAAATLGFKNTRFYTFPNVAEPAYREAAERSLFKSAEAGDRLIFDVTQNEASNDYFKKEAFVHLTYVDAVKLGPVIEEFTSEGMTGKRFFRVIRIDHLPFEK